MTGARTLYIVGSSIFILVGILHLIVHFKQLVAPEAQQKLSSIGKIKISTKKASIWKLWQGMSFLFGIFLIFLGLSNVLVLIPGQYPSTAVICNTMLVLSAIIYSGFAYFGKMQIYVGLLGLILFTLALVFSLM